MCIDITINTMIRRSQKSVNICFDSRNRDRSVSAGISVGTNRWVVSSDGVKFGLNDDEWEAVVPSV